VLLPGKFVSPALLLGHHGVQLGNQVLRHRLESSALRLG
jgi:hypothetical protein